MYYITITLLHVVTIVLCFGVLGFHCNGILFSKL